MAAIVEGMTLYEALRLLVNEKKSGRLRVQHWAGKEGVIGLNNGHVVHCQTGKTRGMDGLKVVRNWVSTSLRFFENVENLGVDIEEDTEEILSSLEAQNREIQTIRKVVPGPETIFALSSASPDGRVFLDAKIWKLISTINGRNSVQDICTMLGASEFSVSKVLYHLHGRKIIERVAVVRPLESQLREPLFEEMETTLAQYVGPMASLVIEDSLKKMGKSRDYVSRNDLPLLVEKVAENVEDEGDRVQYQGAMLALIQKLPREGE